MKHLFSIIYLSFALHGFAQEKKVGLVLSGGGAKGYAHIGVLKALEEANIPIDYIGGTSMGAIIGGLYASGYSAQELETIVYKLDFEKLLLYDRKREEVPYFDKVNKDKYLLELPFDDFKLQIPSAVSKGQGPANVFSYLFRHVGGNIDFNALPIPFLCIGTNLETGEMTVFRKGNLAKSVLASGAYPTLIKPVEIDGNVYTDGGVTNNFPVKQVKAMGADIIIGVDLNDELFKQKNLDTAAKVLEQIIRYRIVNNTEEQKKGVDHYIAPAVNKYSVIDFEKGKEIIKLGYQIAKNQIESIKKSVKRDKLIQNKKGPPIDESILISELKVNGLNDFNESYIKGKMDVSPPHYTNYGELSKGIDNLYATGNFQNIFYELIPSDIGKKLVLNFIEKPNKQTIKFGLHYDDLYKTGVLINLSARKLLFTNSRFSADLILGDNPRYNLNYFIDNGVYPSFGLASTYKDFKTAVPVQGLTIDNLEYDWNELNNRFYTQSTLADRYAIGFGLEHQYISIFSPNVSRNNSLRYIENGYFLNPYAYLGIDNRDDTDFPTKGILFNGIVKHLWFSNSNDFEANSLLDVRIQMNFPIRSKHIVLQAESEFGTFTDVDASRAQYFTLGGFNQQPFLNSNTFYGLPFGYASGPNKWLIRLGLQFNFLENHYIKTIGNVANYEAGIDRINFFEYDYTGVALQYAYDSPLGPLQLFWSYSPQTQQGLINFSLGFWF